MSIMVRRSLEFFYRGEFPPRGRLLVTGGFIPGAPSREEPTRSDFVRRSPAYLFSSANIGPITGLHVALWLLRA